MTSTNTVTYIIRRESIRVGSHYVNRLCNPHWEELERFDPYDGLTIQATGLDEDDESWEGEPTPMTNFMEKVNAKTTRRAKT